MNINAITNSIAAYKSGKKELTEIAAQVAGLTQSLIKEEITTSEYLELLNDIKLEGIIVASSAEIIAKEDLKLIIDSAAAIATITKITI
jgi:hypothetical protein